MKVGRCFQTAEFRFGLSSVVTCQPRLYIRQSIPVTQWRPIHRDYINAAKFTADSLERIEEQTIFIWLNPRSHSALLTGIVAMQFIRYFKVLVGANNVIFLIRFFVQ